MPKKKIPMWRRFLTAALVLAALAAAAFALVTTRWFQDYLKRRTIATLERVTGGRVEISGFHYRPLMLESEIAQVTIHGRESSSEPPLFVARQVEVRIEPWPLVSFKLHFRSLSWASASLHVRIMPDGATNIPGPGAGASSDAEEGVRALLDLSIQRVRLENTDVAWNSSRAPVQMTASNLSLVLRAGPRHLYEGSVAASPITLKGESGILPAISMDSRFTLGPKSLDVQSLRWHSGGIDGTAAAQTGWGPSVHANFSFTADGRMGGVLRALHVSTLRDGRLEMAGEGKYDGDFSVHGRALAQDLDLRLPGFRRVTMDFSTDYALDKRAISMTRMAARLFRGRIEGSAAVALRSAAPEWKFTGSVNRIELATLLGSLAANRPTLQLLHPAASFSGPLQASWIGLLRDARASFDFNLAAPQRAGPGALPISGRVAGQANGGRSFSLTIQSANLQTPHSTIQAQGKLESENLNLQGVVQTSDFEEWRPLIQYYTETSSPIRLNLEQPAGFAGTISGSLASPTVAGKFEAGRFGFQGWQWDAFQATAKLSADGASLTGARLRRGSGVFKGDAFASLDHWKFGPESTVHLDLSAERTPVETVRAAVGIGTPLAGLLSGELSLGGTRDNLEGQGRIEVSRGKIGPVPFDAASTRLQIAHSTWTFMDVTVKKGKASAAGAAQIVFPGRTFSGTLQGNHINLADLFPFKGKGQGKGARPEIQGLADFELHAKGSFENPQGELGVTLAGLRVYGTPIGRAEARATIQGKSITATVAATGPGGGVQFTGKGLAGGDWPVSLAGSFTQVRLDPWIELVAQEQSEPPISVSGYFSLGGPLQDPLRMEGHAAAESLAINFPNLTMENEGPVEVSYARQVLTLGAVRLRGPGTHMDAHGTVSFRETPSLAFEATGKADAALLRLVDPLLRASGNSDLEMRASGPLRSPLVQGTLTVHDVNIGYGDLPFRVTELNGKVELQGDEATMSNMSGTIGAGAVDISGSVTLGRLPRYEIGADLSEVRIRYPSDFTSVLDGRLELIGNKRRGRLGGELTVRNVFVNHNLNIFNLAAPGGNPSGAPAVASPIASVISMGVRVTSSPAVQIETRDARLVADVDLRIQGTLAEPVVMGAIRTRSGSAVFRGNRYSIVRGEIEFNNPFRTEPTLDLDARTRVQSYDLAVQISGPLDRLRFAYRSDPPLATRDLLSLLAFGQPQRSQAMGTANTRSPSSVAASALLSQALSSQVSGRIQELFGVSRISIDPNAGGVSVAAGPVLTVEQRPSPDLSVTYATSTSNSEYRVIQFEWDVSKDVSVIGTRDYNGIFGLELRFRRRFK